MNIAITSLLHRNPWKSRQKQSAVNLYDCLQNLGCKVFYITPSTDYQNFNKDHVGYPERAMTNKGAPKVDILIIHGYVPSEKFFNEFFKVNKKTKIIHNYLENPLEELSCGLSSKEKLNISKFTEELWLPPHHISKKNLMESLHPSGCEAKESPYLWSSFFIDEASRQKKGRTLRFNKDRAGGISILEPNISYIKNFIIPILASEKANLKSPEAINTVSVFNTQHLKNTEFLHSITSGMSINKQKKLYLSNNWEAPDIYSRCGQHIISHQVDSELNYQHLEALYLDLPLIHNSKTISSTGYYYKDSEIELAANQLINSILHHTNNLGEYRNASRELISIFSPGNKRNLDIYASLIFEK